VTRPPTIARPPIPALSEPAMAASQAHLDALTKPPGSLGRLEELLVTVAGITGDARPPLRRPAIVVAAADHGVTRRGVSAYPAAVTAQMVATFVAGGAAVNQLAAAVGAEVVVLDVGVAAPVPAMEEPVRGARLVSRRIRDGTADMTLGPAMRRDEAEAAIGVGRELIESLVASGVDLVGVGEMGIGNTTAASALVAALTGRPAAEVTGRGTGVDDAGWRRKVRAVERAIEVNGPDPDDPVGVLAALGGLEIAALVGAILAATHARVPVVLDGFITGAAALVAARLAPGSPTRWIPAHRSTEPGHGVVLDELGLRPLLDLELRLGEGTGAALAIGLLAAAVRVRDGMATFASAGVAGRRDG